MFCFLSVYSNELRRLDVRHSAYDVVKNCCESVCCDGVCGVVSGNLEMIMIVVFVTL